MNTKQLQSEIMFGQFSNDDLNALSQAIQFARSQLAKETKGKLAIGSTVSFVNPKNHTKYIGRVTKVAIKYITVATNVGTNYRVPASMLTVE